MCMRQMIIRLMIAALAISLWVSCDQEKTIMYRQEAGVRFMYQAEDEYSFVDNYGETVHLYYITVATTGDSVDYERKVSIAVVENDTNYVNTARPEQYKLLEGVVPAGSFSGEVPVEIHCTPDMSDSSFVVNIKLVPNEDFPLAGFDNRYFELSMTNQLVKPKNWGNLAFYFGQQFSISWYRFILNVLNVSYIPYPSAQEGDEKWSYNQLLANAGKVKAALLQYNREHPNDPLRHEDGDYAGDEVKMP